MEIDRWLSLPSRLKWSKPDPDDYDSEEGYSVAYGEWLDRVEDYEIACDREVDRAKEQRYETGS
jgi:hypothetical protein